MPTTIKPLLRQSLSNDLAQRVNQMIRAGGFAPGDRLPAITELARRFKVGHPTVREALKKLETIGVVEIRHGSGVFVGRNQDSLLLSNPIFHTAVSKKLLLDLIEARTPVELTSVALAAANASEADIADMRQLLATASANIDDDDLLSETNLAFHRRIAAASNNSVLAQLLQVLTSLFQQEQRWILDIYGWREKDHAEHIGILEALEARDQTLAVERMRAHLAGVRETLLRWDPEAPTAR